MTVTITGKTYTYTNGNPNDASQVNTEFVNAFNNDAAIKTKVDTMLAGNLEDATTLTLNSIYTGSSPSNMFFNVERGTLANTGFKWNESAGAWQVTHDGSAYLPISYAGASDPGTPVDGSTWYNSTSKLFKGQQNSATVYFVTAPAPVSYGQCRLTKSSSNLLLSPYNGNNLMINSVLCAVPDAGVTLTTSGLSTSTEYNIYAYMNSGTMTLEASTTAYAIQAGTGLAIKNGDATRTLVGRARTNGSTAWVDSSNQRFVISYFNRRNIEVYASYTAARSTSSASYAEPNTEIRNEFLTWDDEAVTCSVTGRFTCGSNVTAAVSIGIDGTTAGEVYCPFTFPSSGTWYAPISGTLNKTLALGYHYATVLAMTPAGTNTLEGSGSAGARTTLTTLIRG